MKHPQDLSVFLIISCKSTTVSRVWLLPLVPLTWSWPFLPFHWMDRDTSRTKRRQVIRRGSPDPWMAVWSEVIPSLSHTGLGCNQDKSYVKPLMYLGFVCYCSHFCLCWLMARWKVWALNSSSGSSGNQQRSWFVHETTVVSSSKKSLHFLCVCKPGISSHLQHMLAFLAQVTGFL